MEVLEAESDTLYGADSGAEQLFGGKRAIRRGARQGNANFMCQFEMAG